MDKTLAEIEKLTRKFLRFPRRSRCRVNVVKGCETSPRCPGRRPGAGRIKLFLLRQELEKGILTEWGRIGTVDLNEVA
jgi:hypothetical protein